MHIEKYWFVEVTYAGSKYCLTPSWQIKLTFDKYKQIEKVRNEQTARLSDLWYTQTDRSEKEFVHYIIFKFYPVSIAR